LRQALDTRSPRQILQGLLQQRLSGRVAVGAAKTADDPGFEGLGDGRRGRRLMRLRNRRRDEGCLVGRIATGQGQGEEKPEETHHTRKPRKISLTRPQNDYRNAARPAIPAKGT